MLSFGLNTSVVCARNYLEKMFLIIQNHTAAEH